MLSTSGGVWLSSGLLVIRRVAVLFNWFSHFSLTAATTSDLQILRDIKNLKHGKLSNPDGLLGKLEKMQEKISKPI